MTKIKSMYLALFVALLAPMSANAVLIEITGQGENDGLWEVTLVEDSFENVMADLVNQVWWGDSALAAIFANAVGPVAGVNNLGLNFGPLFVWSTQTTETFERLIYSVYSDNGLFGDGTLSHVTTTSPNVFSRFLVFATAERVSVPEPGTLALLGIGLAGMGMSRRKRKI